MAATIGYQAPRVGPGPNGNVIESMSLPVVAAQTVNDNDVLILSGGKVETSGNNPAIATLAGLALHASGAVFAGGAAGASVSKYATPFGAFTSGFNAEEVTNLHFIPFHNGQLFEFSLNTATALADSLVGTQVGLVKDGTTGFFYVDGGQTNKVAVIRSIVNSPTTGVIGTDNGGRVLVEFLSGTAI